MAKIEDASSGSIDITHLLSRTEAEVRYINSTGDTMTGDLNMGGKKITNLADPTNFNHAATRNYVDNQGEAFVTKVNGELDGDLDCDEFRLKNVKDPEDSKDATNKNYVDSKFITKQNGELSSDLDCKNKRLKNIGIPSDDKDAVNKHYVTANYLGGVFNLNVDPGHDTFSWDARVKRLTGVGDPIDYNDAAHKSYVDNKVRDSLNNIPVPSSDTSAVSKSWVHSVTTKTFESIGLAKIIPFYAPITLSNTRTKVGFTAAINVLTSRQLIDPNQCIADYSLHPSARQERTDERTRIKNLSLEHRNKSLTYTTIQTCVIRSYRSSAATESNPLFMLDVLFHMTAKKDSPTRFYIQGTLRVFNEEITESPVIITIHNAVSRSDIADAEESEQVGLEVSAETYNKLF